LVAALRVIYRKVVSPQIGAKAPGGLVEIAEPKGESSVMA
jgi:hypothetical protein